LLRETNSVACLQFSPENPNPKIRVHSRGMLLESCDSLFPVENFIFKQFEDGEVENITLPRDWEEHPDQFKINANKINEIGFNHLYFPHPEKISEEDLSKALKLCIDEILFLEEELKK
jgi:hypothetical protein